MCVCSVLPQALYDYLPSEGDLQPLLAWLAVMEKAHVHLGALQSALSLAHLPRLCSAAMSCLLSPHTQVVAAAASTLKVGARTHTHTLLLMVSKTNVYQ